MLELNDTQSGVLEIVFAVADDNGWLLLGLDDLRSLLGHAAEARKEISAQYGLISTQSIGALQRAILRIASQGGDLLFGEPALELSYAMRTTTAGRGGLSASSANHSTMQPTQQRAV